MPAAGVGSRMGADNGPKQYLALGGKPMLEHSIDAMLTDARIERVFVVVAPSDTRWPSIRADAARVEFLPVGGASRAESVRNGLDAIAGRVEDNDRVLVHDAARPCLGAAQLTGLIDGAGGEDGGGLLAVPLSDTLKRADDGRVAATLDRSSLWCAQTPQCSASDPCARRWRPARWQASPTRPARWSAPATRRVSWRALRRT